MSLGSKLKQLRTMNGLTMDELADLLNRKYDYTIAKSMISRWENDKTTPLNQYLSAYAREFKVSLDYLLGLDEEETSIPSNVIPINKVRMIPILGEIACGDPIWAIENYDGYFALDSSIHADFILYAKGDSMIDIDIRDGDKCFIRKTDIAEDGQIVAVLLDDSATLKRVYKTDTGWILRPENKSYAPIVVTGDIKILGVLVGVYKTGF